MLKLSRFGGLLGWLLLGACSEEVPPESVEPLRLAIDDTVATWSPLPIEVLSLSGHTLGRFSAPIA